MKKRWLALIGCILAVMFCMSAAAASGDIVPLDPAEYQLPADAEMTDAAKGLQEKDLINGHDPAEFVKEGPYRIGVSFQELTNPVWAGIAKYLKELGPDYDMTYEIVDCGSDASKQVSQLENYIQSGVDGILIGGVDSAALEDVTARALDAGIPVVGIGFNFGYGNCVLAPADLQAGEACATFAADWVNEKFDGKTQIAILNYPLDIACMDRGNAIEATLKELLPDSEIVAIEAAVTLSEGYSATESILQAYPDVKVICCIGDGGAVGACEAVIAAGKNTDDFGVFGIDGTDEAIIAISDPTNPYRTSVSFGGAIGWASHAVDVFDRIFNGGEVENVEMQPLIPVTNDNLESYSVYSGLDLGELKS